MPVASHIHIRQLEVGDFGFVRELAAKQPTFTVPPPYVLWLLLKIKDAVCLVAEHSSNGLIAYLLSVPVEGPAKTLYVWQLATCEKGTRTDATVALLVEFRRIARELHIRRIAFSSTPASSRFRAIRRHVANVFSVTPEPISSVPSLVCPNEQEFQFDLILR